MKQLDYKLNSWSFFDLAMLKITSLLSEPESTAKLLQKIDTNTERANY